MKNIMIVDMQKGFINKNNNFLVKNIQNFLDKNNFDNVIFTQFKNNPTGPFVNFLDWNGLLDDDSQKFVINSNHEMIEKSAYGISIEDIKNLKCKGLTEIYICGTDIDACVLDIAFNFFDSNIKPVFIKELCGTSSSNSKINDAAWLIIERNFGKKCIASIKDFTSNN